MIGAAVVGDEVVLLLSAAVVDAVEVLVVSGVIVEMFMAEPLEVKIRTAHRMERSIDSMRIIFVL